MFCLQYEGPYYVIQVWNNIISIESRTPDTTNKNVSWNLNTTTLVGWLTQTFLAQNPPAT